MARVRFRTLGCYPLTGAIRSEAATVPEIIEELIATRYLRAPRPRHRPRPVRLDGEEEAGGLFLMARLSVVGSGERSDAGERVDARIAAEEKRSLLRFLTCGSVDDGKSTLIGRLLYDSATGLRGSDAERGAFAPTGAGKAAPLDLALLIDGLAGRARAEDHHRRRLSLFLDAAAEIHRRRHAGPRPVHAQHGDRRVELRFRRAAGRCAQRHADPDPPPRLHPVAARHRQGGARRQQDGPGRFRSGAVRGDRRGLCRALPTSSASSRSPPSRCRRSRATTWSTPARICTGIAGRRCSGIWRRSMPAATGASGRSASRCNG